MTLTLLLDLDDTLLATGTDQFTQAYLDKLGAYLERAVHIPASQVIHHLLVATEAMVRNNQPDCTLEQAFNQVFYPALGTTAVDLQPVIVDFYNRIYPTLQEKTFPMPGAKAFVESAFEKGWRIAIATNPLFPETAVRQRLAWANLPLEKYPFELLGSFESFHFSKPNPAYFTEVYSRLGCGDGPVLVAGDDLARDVLPAQKAGLPVYHIRNYESDQTSYPDSLPAGTLEDLVRYLVGVDPDSLCPQVDGPDAIMAQLRATPAALCSQTALLHGDQWLKQPAEGEWSLTEIFCHLRDVECEVNLPRLLQVTSEENPFLAAVDTDVWASQRSYFRQDGPLALREFVRGRKQSLDLLGSLSQDRWQTSFRHAIFGQTTIQDLTGFTATHDRVHIQQAYRLLPSPDAS